MEDIKMTKKEERIMDEKYFECMDKVKNLELLPKFNAATKAMVAEYFEVAVDIVAGDIARHRKELSKFGLKKARYNDFEKCGYSFERSDYAHTRVYVYGNSEINVTNAGILLFPKEAIFNMAERLNSPIAERSG